MKNFAKIIIFFSVTFAITFLAAILFGFVTFWVDSARIISPEAGLGRDFAGVAWTAIIVAVYFSILLTLGYSARAKMPVSLSIFCTAALAFAFAAGTSLGTRRLEALQPAFTPQAPIQASPGLILSRRDNSIILLKESSEARGPRLVSIPGQPFIYQELPVGPNNTVLSLPPVSFGDVVPWFLQSVGIDFSISGGHLKALFEDNLLSFAAYAFALILLLSSLRFILELSQWPLANIFLAAFVFRLILSFEIFLNSGEINTLIYSFLTGQLPPALITPITFAVLGILVILYTILTRIARSGGRRSKRDWND